MNISSYPLPAHGSRTPFGVMLHTTGDGVPKAAYASGLSPQASARAIYASMKEGPHYCIAPDGSIDKYREPVDTAWHVGVSAENRRDFFTGHWENIVSRPLVSWWKARWPGVKSPSHLYPSTSPNSDYIGIEMIPCGTYVSGNGGSWKPVFGQPMPVEGGKGRFTGAQYVAAAMLTLTLCKAHSIIPRKAGRVVGHEDINPLTRPGWDPGGFQGYWSWEAFWGIADGLEKHA